MALNLNDVNAVFNKIQQDKKCYQDMYVLMAELDTNEINPLDPVSQERRILSDYIQVLGKQKAYGNDEYLYYEYDQPSIRADYERIDDAGFTADQKAILKADYLALFPFLAQDPALDGANNQGNGNGYGNGNGAPSPPNNAGGARRKNKKTRKASKKSRRNRKSRRI